MGDVEKECSDNGCKVLATNMRGKTCKDYCEKDGRECVGAWEEVDETCSVLAVMQCDQTWGTTSDLICECSPHQGIAPSSGAPRKNVSELKLVWSDEFEGSEVDMSKWSPIHGGGGFGNNEAQFYRWHNAEVSDGSLKITAKCEEHSGQHFTSAKLETKHKADWGPGHRVDVRARLPTGKGTWPAIWMLPTDSSYGDWPKSGEIDIAETVGCTANKVYGTVHTEAYNHMLHTEKSNAKRLDFGSWHTYSIEWTDSQISWYVDDQLYHSFAPSSHSHDKWPYDRQFYLILNVAVGGSWGGYCLHGRRPSCSSASEFGHAQVMEVDYARVYEV
jgi:beta-glucanase (GH16 family)